MSRILIVEDEVAIADLEKDYLELSGVDRRRRTISTRSVALVSAQMIT